MEDLFISPKIDFSFKEIMKKETSLKSFLSAVLKLPLAEIKRIKFIDRNLDKKHPEDKLGILDVRLILNDEQEIDIELQIAYFKYWTNRTIFYTCRQFADQAEEGDFYQKFRKCIHISILDFNLFAKQETADFHNCFHLREDSKGVLYTEMLEFHTLELKKLPPDALQSNDLLMLWASFINAKNEEELEMLGQRDPGLREALRSLNAIKMDKATRETYLRRQMAIMDHKSQALAYREDGLKEGIEIGVERGLHKGRAEGQKEGIEIGVKRGLHKGREEGLSLANQNFVRKALAMGLDLESIVELTGLSPEEIAKLQ